MDASVEFTAIPRYNALEQCKDYLEQKGVDLAKLAIHQVEHAVTIVGRTSPRTLARCSKLCDHIDVLLLRGLEYAAPVPGEQLVMGGRLYVPHAKEHPGVMSGNKLSDAQYLGMVERPNDTTFLLQYIRPHGKTSEHYHQKTKEFFLSLLGKTVLKCKDIVSKNERLEEIANSVFTRVLPGTTHQLQTYEEGGLNVLCMDPYDPDKKDHFYVR